MHKPLHYLAFAALAAFLAFAGAAPFAANAQASESQWYNGFDSQDVRSFSQFLSNHPWIANKLWEKPSRANSKDFQEDNKELRYYLKDHPRVGEALRENARGFLSQVRDFQGNRNYRGDTTYSNGNYEYNNGVNRAEMARFNQFLDDHSKIARDLYKNPSLVNNSDYVQDHKELRDFLRSHPDVWNALRDNPRAFMNGNRGYDNPGYDE